MDVRILIVEDEMLVAAELEATLEDLGHEPVGIAPDLETAMSLTERKPDLALVDLNLRDGPTGETIGRKLSGEHGIAVLFVTANPRMLGDGVAGTIGVLSKPYCASTIESAVDYALKMRRGGRLPPPPAHLKLFSQMAA